MFLFTAGSTPHAALCVTQFNPSSSETKAFRVPRVSIDGILDRSPPNHAYLFQSTKDNGLCKLYYFSHTIAMWRNDNSGGYRA